MTEQAKPRPVKGQPQGPTLGGKPVSAYTEAETEQWHKERDKPCPQH